MAVKIGDYPRCATYMFRRIIKGESLAYLSVNPYLWDLGPSSLLLEKSYCGMFDLDGNAIDFKRLSQAPFCQPTAVVMPLRMKEDFFTRLRPLLES